MTLYHGVFGFVGNFFLSHLIFVFFQLIVLGFLFFGLFNEILFAIVKFINSMVGLVDLMFVHFGEFLHIFDLVFYISYCNQFFVFQTFHDIFFSQILLDFQQSINFFYLLLKVTSFQQFVMAFPFSQYGVFFQFVDSVICGSYFFSGLVQLLFGFVVFGRKKDIK